MFGGTRVIIEDAFQPAVTQDQLSVSLDRLVVSALDLSKSEFRAKLASIVLAEIDGSSYRVTEPDFQQILNGIHNNKHKRLLAITLLRVLSTDRSKFDDKTLSRSAVLLFDTMLSNDFYKSLDLQTSTQTYKKLDLLEGVVSDAEEKLDSIFMGVFSISALPSFREQLLRTLNSKNELVRPIIFPFVPRAIYDSGLNNLFSLVTEYDLARQQLLSTTVELQLQVINACANYISACRTVGTQYARRYFQRTAEKITESVVSDFSQSPLSQPAEVAIDASEKKYPLHSTGGEVTFNLFVENEGPGPAYDTRIWVNEITDIEIARTEQYLGQLPVGGTIVPISGFVTRESGDVVADLGVKWRNPDGTEKTKISTVLFQAQSSDIPWESLNYYDPYELEPVTTKELLVGRSEVLRALLRDAKANSMRSSYVWGQKRVGKTSIAKTLENLLKQSEDQSHLVIYIEGGEFVHPDPLLTIESLGTQIVDHIRSYDRRFSTIERPQFSGALSPIYQYISAVQAIDSNLRILIILDEFDELPVSLYDMNDTAKAFFLTLRSLSNNPLVGVILIGGENMDHVITGQGKHLNKFTQHRVDYFDKSNQYSDFQELVRRPVEQWFEVADSAISRLYDATSGNPYFTKFICARLFRLMVERRDSHITEQEANEAIRKALDEIAGNSFQHFWDDRISGVTERIEDISLQRRRTLVATASAIRERGIADIDSIGEYGREFHLSNEDTNIWLQEFTRRRILTESPTGYDFYVQFFGNWMCERGVSEISVQVIDQEAERQRFNRDQNAYVTASELTELVGQWSTFRGRHITEDTVRAWLQQFGANSNQRLMFKILKSLRFYSDGLVREKLHEAHGIVRRGVTQHIVENRRKRDEVLVSYIDEFGKSGPRFATLYAEENHIYVDNIVERSKISDAIDKNRSIQAIVFVDDILGTGNSAASYFKALNDECGEILRKNDMNCYFVTITGFQDAKINLEKIVRRLNLPVEIHLCDPMADSSRVFDPNSEFFESEDDRETAKRLALQYGKTLVKDSPLGYGDSEAAIVFAYSCPNNTLPILWERSNTWIPLFPRH